jgi:hypothetical protein
MTQIHSITPDIVRDILAEARRPDAAEAVAVHVRPEIHALIRRQVQDEGDERIGIRLVVDDTIPASPGYEVHRAVAPSRGRPSGHRRSDGRAVDVLLAA